MSCQLVTVNNGMRSSTTELTEDTEAGRGQRETGSRIGCGWAQVWAVLGELCALGGEERIADANHKARSMGTGPDIRLRRYI